MTGKLVHKLPGFPGFPEHVGRIQFGCHQDMLLRAALPPTGRLTS